MAALHTTLPSDNHQPFERPQMSHGLRRAFSSLRTPVTALAQHRAAALCATIAGIWIATIAVALLSTDVALWFALSLAVVAPVVAAGALRRPAPAMLAAIPAIGVAIGVVAVSTATSDGGWDGLIALATCTTALVIAVAAVADALAREHGNADSAWRLAEERVQLSEEFVSFIAHEIRTPMTMIAGTADVLRRNLDSLSPAERAEALANLEDEVMRLSHLADELMSVARRSAGQSPCLAPVPVAAIVEETVRRHHKMFNARPIDLTFDDPDAVVEASPLLTSHVLANLLVNAEKYSPPGERIEVRTTTDRAMVEIEVRDRGAGIPPGDQSRIFSLFYRSPSATRAADGHGVGLALSRRLVEAQGGHLWAEARRGGPGSAFHIVLPGALRT